MKRILVIDESEIVRETLALILGREFAVVKRPLGAREFPISAAREEVDLLILGVTPQLGTEAAALLRFAAQLPFAVLFLVDSKTVARAIQEEAEIGCLAKPFNPYELHEKVGSLLARRSAARRPVTAIGTLDSNDPTLYLNFPFLSRSASLLARRFASARFPLLITGELGCGQDHVISAICGLSKPPSLRLAVNAIDTSTEYLSRKLRQLSLQSEFSSGSATLIIENLDKCSQAGQTLMLNFLTDVETQMGDVRYLATANADLLEKVYRGELLEELYYKLATLTLRLSPLRERADDISALADCLARTYATKLALPEPVLLPETHLRLKTYLWFGNLRELETVIARTLAFHRKSQIGCEDLIFDFGSMPQATLADEPKDVLPEDEPKGRSNAEPKLEIYRGSRVAKLSPNGHAKSVELKTVIHELAHELKNPMVTIKTFAQLLEDRYQDENFRTRFQEVVGNDIDRMDDLLEVMLEFAGFAQPSLTRLALGDRLRAVLTELQVECSNRQVRFEWKGIDASGMIRADEAQLDYILKNVLLVALSEARRGSEIEVDISTPGFLEIHYPRESPRMASISHYLNEAASGVNQGSLPLRALLAKYLLERNGGLLAIDASDQEKEILRMELPIAER